jgi:hypothetical protein
MAALAMLFTLIRGVQFAVKLKNWSFPQGAATEILANASVLTLGLALSIGLLYGAFRRSKTVDTPPS